MNQRLFIALWPTPVVRAAIAQWQGMWTWPPHVARVKADKLHLTLHFLGDVPAPRVPELVRSSRVPFEPFELELGEAAVWPHGIAVLQPLATPVALQRLHAALASRLLQLDFTLETRAYRPHVTLARRAYSARPPQGGPGVRWQVDEGYVLVRSAGAEYEVIHRF